MCQHFFLCCKLKILIRMPIDFLNIIKIGNIFENLSRLFKIIDITPLEQILWRFWHDNENIDSTKRGDRQCDPGDQPVVPRCKLKNGRVNYYKERVSHQSKENCKVLLTRLQKFQHVINTDNTTTANSSTRNEEENIEPYQVVGQ